MSLSTLRRVRRLRHHAKTVFAKYRSYWEDVAPSQAEQHLLRLIAVFRYGEPRIDEPLGVAYRRALSRLAGMVAWKKRRRVIESDCLNHLRELLIRESPARDINAQISTYVQQMPDWLRHLCNAKLSMKLLGLDAAPVAEDVLRLRPKKSDRGAWPFLPKGMLEPGPEYEEDEVRYMDEMSLKEQLSLLRIYRKPEHEWTRDEHRFVKAMLARDPKFGLRGSDKQD